jgi:hypothetical protein
MKREIWIERTGPDGKPKLFGPYASPADARRDGFVVEAD